jgi:hypothetical protein
MPKGDDTAAFSGKGAFHRREKVAGGVFIEIYPGVSGKTGKIEPGGKTRQEYKTGNYTGFGGTYGGEGPDNRNGERFFHTYS